MTAVGHGIYRLAYSVPTAGSYIGKITRPARGIPLAVTAAP